MEGILETFKSDLGSISNEIKLLQDQSTSMDVKLQNRKVRQTANVRPSLKMIAIRDPPSATHCDSCFDRSSPRLLIIRRLAPTVRVCVLVFV